MKRPVQPYGWASVTAEDWRALGAVLADTDPRPLDERTPRPAAPLAFLVLAAVGVIAPLWALIVIVGA